MRILKYVIAPIFILLLLGLAVMPWIDGYYFKQAYLKGIAQANTRSPLLIQVVSYDLGWLSSSAKLHITNRQASKTDIGVDVIQHIQHGPFIHDPIAGWNLSFVKIISDVRPDSVLQADFARNLNSQTPIKFTLTTTINFKQQIVNQVQSDMFIAQPSSQYKISLQPSTGTFELLNNGNFTSSYDINGLSMQSAKGDSLAVPIINLGFSLICNSTNCAKEGTIVIPSLTAVSMGQSYEAKGINASWSYALTPKNMLNAKINLNIGQFASNILSVSPASINIEIHNFNQLRAQKFLMGLGEIQAKTKAPFGQALTIMLTQAGFVLINPEFTLTENIDITTQYGALRSTGEISWPKNKPLPQSSEEMKKNIYIKVNLFVSPGWMDRIISMVAENIDAQHAAQEKTKPVQALPDIKTEKAQFIQSLTVMVQNKQLTPVGAAIIQRSLQKHNAPAAFNAGIEQGLSRYQVVKEVVPTIKAEYAKIIADETKAITIIFAQPAKNTDELKNQISKLVQNGLLAEDGAKQLNLLIDQNLDPTIYTSVLNNLMASDLVPLAVGNYLLDGYTRLRDAGSAAAQTNTVDAVRKMLDDKIQRGFVTVDNNGYSTQVVYANGILTVNGKLFSFAPPPPTPNPGTVPPASPNAKPGLPPVPAKQAAPTPSTKAPIQTQIKTQTNVQTVPAASAPMPATVKPAPTPAATAPAPAPVTPPPAASAPSSLPVPAATPGTPASSAAAPAPVSVPKPAAPAAAKSADTGITPALVPAPIPVPPEPAL